MRWRAPKWRTSRTAHNSDIDAVSRSASTRFLLLAVGGGDEAPGHVVAEKRDACGMSAVRHGERVGVGAVCELASVVRARKAMFGALPQKDLESVSKVMKRGQSDARGA
jgi:hypothetical protein